MTNAQTRERTLSRILQLADKVVEPLGLAVLEVRIGQQGRRKTLEVCIVRPHGAAIGLTDCEKVSKALDKILEEDALKFGPVVQGEFVLEVVSPGIERQLTTPREFKVFAGERIKVTAKEKIGELGCEFVCTLLGGDEANLKVAAARRFLSGQSKAAPAKGVKKAAKKEDIDLLSSEDTEKSAFVLSLSKVFKINLYADHPIKGKPSDLQLIPGNTV